MITGAQLRLRSINELLQEHERFVVPSYQRGFRWTARQVEALLDDLERFYRSSHGSGASSYYCLQPIVLRRRKDARWDIVDGQQRLTTILLILAANQQLTALLRRSPYEIEYETRPGSAAFLMEPRKERASESIDYHYIYEAHEAIGRWFRSRDQGLAFQLLGCLTGPDDLPQNVRVVWYELDANEDPVKAFVRLNVGRIPLTSAELIRALLLKSSQGLEGHDAEQITHEWDLLERRLQDDAYWYFLQNGTFAPPARIEYLFDIFVRMRRQTAPQAQDDDPLATFLEFQGLLDGKPGQVSELWREFEHLAHTLEDWHEDRTLFHLVGFLLATVPRERASESNSRRDEATWVVDFVKSRRDMTRSAFDRHLRRLAWKRLAGPKGEPLPRKGLTREMLDGRIADLLEDVHYPSDRVRTILLLFNIAGLLQQTASTQRFQFDTFKTNDWDVEHVRSVAEYVPRSPADRKRWLDHTTGFVTMRAEDGVTEAKTLSDRINLLSADASPDEDDFMDVFAKVRALSGEADARDDDHGLSNLALLDYVTNRSYKNAIFPVKRARVIELDKQGQFVPPATRNVFLKYYSDNPRQLILWDSADQEDYKKKIMQTLADFFAPLVKEDA